MHQEDELDFDEDDLVPQAFAMPSSSSSSSLQSRSQPHSATVTASLATSATIVPTAASTKPPPHDTSLDSLGRKLPQGWVSRMSNTTGELYYRNTVSNTSSWEIPTTSAVEIKNDSPPPTPQTLPPTSQPQVQQQQQVQSTSSSTRRVVEQNLPTGPKIATQPDRAKLGQSTSSSSSAAATLPTGPRASSQSTSNPPRQPAASTGVARYPTRPTPSSTSTSTSRPDTAAVMHSQKSSTSNESSKPSTSSSSIPNELPKGPRASIDQHQRRQSIPSQSSAVQSSTSRSSRDPPTGPAPRNPNPARSVNAIPVAPRTSQAGDISSASTESLNTSRSIVDERRSSVPSAKSNGEPSRGLPGNRFDRESTNPRALSVITSLPRGPRHGPRHSAPILPPSKPLVTAESKRTQEKRAEESSDLRRASFSAGSSSRIVEQQSRPSPLAREESSSRPRSRNTSPRAQDRSSTGGRRVETSTRRVDDLDRSLDDYNRGREGRDGEKGDRRERERSPARKEEARRERSRSRDRYAKVEETRRSDEGKERDLKRGGQNGYDSNTSKRDQPAPATLQRAPSSSTADSRRPRSLRELSKSPPIAPSPAQRQKARDEARKEQQRGVSIELAGAGGARSDRSRREGSRPDRNVDRSRDAERDERGRMREVEFERERERERERLKAIDIARERERDMIERERQRESYRDERRDRDEDRYRDRGRDRREVSPPLLRFASSTTPFLPPPSPPRASRTRTRSQSPPIPRPPVSKVAPQSTSSSRGGGGGSRAIHIEIGGSAIVKTPASFRGKYRIPDREEILGHSIVPLMRIVGSGSTGLDDLDARERRRERSPPLASYRGERSHGDAGGGGSRRYDRSRSPVRERSPVRSRNKSPVRDSINRSSDLKTALPPRPNASSPKPTTPSLLSRMSGLPERPVTAVAAVKERPMSINGAAKRIRDPEEVIREAELKKRRGL